MQEVSKLLVPRNLKEPCIDFTRSLVFFDGAFQGTLGIFGARAILSLDKSHYLSLKYGVDKGTNNRAKIYSLHILLKVIVDKLLRKIQVFGDSKLVINWENEKVHFSNLVLETIREQLLEIKALFEEVSFVHAFREFNHTTDHLSK